MTSISPVDQPVDPTPAFLLSCSLSYSSLCPSLSAYYSELFQISLARHSALSERPPVSALCSKCKSIRIPAVQSSCRIAPRSFKSSRCSSFSLVFSCFRCGASERTEIAKREKIKKRKLGGGKEQEIREQEDNEENSPISAPLNVSSFTPAPSPPSLISRDQKKFAALDFSTPKSRPAAVVKENNKKQKTQHKQLNNTSGVISSPSNGFLSSFFHAQLAAAQTPGKSKEKNSTEKVKENKKSAEKPVVNNVPFSFSHPGQQRNSSALSAGKSSEKIGKPAAATGPPGGLYKMFQQFKKE